MEYIGQIEAKADDEALTCNRWLEFIAERSELVHAPSRMVRNPATGQMIEARPPPDAVQLIRQGANLGSFSWAQDGSAAVDVMCCDGYRKFMAEAAREFAHMLGGRFSEYHANS